MTIKIEITKIVYGKYTCHSFLCDNNAQFTVFIKYPSGVVESYYCLHCLPSLHAIVTSMAAN
jgi:hypothetical protein